MMTETILDCRGLSCPMPIVKISMSIRKLAEGELLTVLADDPAFKTDLEAWAEKTGNELVEFNDGTEQQALLKRR